MELEGLLGPSPSMGSSWILLGCLVGAGCVRLVFSLLILEPSQKRKKARDFKIKKERNLAKCLLRALSSSGEAGGWRLVKSGEKEKQEALPKSPFSPKIAVDNIVDC